ncbi:helix-turn-helix domain-containing protein [Streptomyces europaeiscabiei]|uniref:helix-turn-helix domain-containing protein n=1 Tax=Streptomyces europaeiscabiei TaxID=146819 RepID=UPI0029A03475|nr:helix-turn-helix domain-containing protein [Streptomyces europaeiscabiei]MDX3584202.1 helix-turn-helix domain-containing protein [Streptomyces europaeiscabiei]
MSTAESHLGDRLNYLFEHMHPPGRPYTNAYVAEQVGISEQYVSMLRRGTRSKPDLDLLKSLSRFFGVPDGFLSGTMSVEAVAKTEEEIKVLVAMRDARVRAIALRAVGLPPAVQESLTEIITQFRQQMGLPLNPAADRHEPS